MRFAVVSDRLLLRKPRPSPRTFQSALRFAVVSDVPASSLTARDSFQSALRFAVVSDFTSVLWRMRTPVSIRFEVRGGFRRDNIKRNFILRSFNPL